MKITKDQARGMLVGKAVGDALGAPLEFEPKCRDLNNLVSDMIAEKGIVHIECEPGDVVCWHSSLWHYSPPNPSLSSRIAIAGVWTNPIINKNRKRELSRWALKKGKICGAFPPESAAFPDDVPFKPAAHKKV